MKIIHVYDGYRVELDPPPLPPFPFRLLEDAENPAVSTVLEHLQVYAVLEDTLSPAEKRDHARRIVDAVLGLNGAKVAMEK